MSLKALWTAEAAFERFLVRHAPMSLVATLMRDPFHGLKWYVDLDRENRAEIIAYMALLGKRYPAVSHLLDASSDRLSPDAPAHACIARIPADVMSALWQYKASRLIVLSRIFSQLGMIRTGAIIRAVLLVRTARDIAARHDAAAPDHAPVTIELFGNDYALAIMDLIRPDDRSADGKLTAAHVALKALDTPAKARLYCAGGGAPDEVALAHLHGRTLRLQGPSNRPSELAASTVDHRCTIGYSGPASLTDESGPIGISYYMPHKIDNLIRTGRIGVLGDLDLAVMDRQMEPGVLSDLGGAALPPCAIVRADVRTTSLGSQFNSGTSFLVWLLSAGPAHLAVSHVDLFLNLSYPSGYIANRPERLLERDGTGWAMPNWSALQSFGVHNPSQQFAVYRFFGGQDDVTYDDVLRSIIDQPFSAYAAKLEATYASAD